MSWAPTLHPSSTKMQALQIQLHGPENHASQARKKASLHLVTLPVPNLVPGSALVRIRAVAINPSDAANAQGFFPHTTYPRVPGRDWAGEVSAGPAHLVGKRVFGTSGRELGFTSDGPSAEYCLIPETGVVEMPCNLSFVQATTIGVPFTTAWLMVERAHIKASDVIVVVGSSGAVGRAACQLSKARGCRVITAARRSTADIDLTLGPGQLSSAKTLTGGVGPDVVLDTVGDPYLMNAGLDVLAVRGRLSYISAPKTQAAQFCFDMRNLYRTEKTIIGCNSIGYSNAEMTAMLKELAPNFESGGACDASPESAIVTVGLREHGLQAYEKVGRNDGLTSGKYVIVMD